MRRKIRILDLAFTVSDLPPLGKFLLITMARLGNSSGRCYASQETLASKCCCSIRTVRRLLKVLREAGLVVRIPDSTRSTDSYVLLYQRWTSERKEGGQRGLSKRPTRPQLTGQFGRENPKVNPNLNQDEDLSPTRCHEAVRLDGPSQQVLSRIKGHLEDNWRRQESA